MQMITKQQQIEYEIGRTNLVQSFLYSNMPRYHRWILNRRYKRYLQFVEMMNQHKKSE